MAESDAFIHSRNIHFCLQAPCWALHQKTKGVLVPRELTRVTRKRDHYPEDDNATVMLTPRGPGKEAKAGCYVISTRGGPRPRMDRGRQEATFSGVVLELSLEREKSEQPSQAR